MKSHGEAMRKSQWLRTALIICAVSVCSSAQRTTPRRATPVSADKETQSLLDVGQAAYEQGRYDDALRNYNKAIALAPNSPKTAATAYLRIGNVYMSERQFDSAAAAY